MYTHIHFHNSKRTRDYKRTNSSTADSFENKTIDYDNSIDTIYLASNVELGGIRTDNIKDKNVHSKMHLSLGLKDMIAKLGGQSPKIVHDIHILGYHITGNREIHIHIHMCINMYKL